MMSNTSEAAAFAGAAAIAEESADVSFPPPNTTRQEPDLSTIPRGPPGPASVTTVATELASEFGLRVGDPDTASLKSITFLKDKPAGMEWDIKLADPVPVAGRMRTLKRLSSKTNLASGLVIESVGGSVALSQVQPGDYLKSINEKRIGPSYNAERAMEQMNQCLEEEGLLSIVSFNKAGDETVVRATIIKPRPNMTYEDMGMVVWYWGCLCIKSIDKDSIFRHSVLKSEDHLVSIADIPCDTMKPEQFADIIEGLPLEVTIVVRRRKQRFSGAFN